jgi:hypothetical protein
MKAAWICRITSSPVVLGEVSVALIELVDALDLLDLVRVPSLFDWLPTTFVRDKWVNASHIEEFYSAIEADAASQNGAD